MSRSGYSDDFSGEQWALIRWRGQVASAMRGKRGQRMFREMKAALESMPEKALTTGELEAEGAVCALGALGKARGIDMSVVDPYEPEQVSKAFDIAEPLAQEIAFMNDECGMWRETDEERWTRMYRWVCAQIKEEKP